MENYPEISVVIPNIGEKSILDVVSALNNGSVIPKEIILVLAKSKCLEFIFKGLHIFRNINPPNESKMLSSGCQNLTAKKPFSIFRCF